MATLSELTENGTTAGISDGTALSTSNSIFDAFTGTGTPAWKTDGVLGASYSVQLTAHAATRTSRANLATAQATPCFGFKVKAVTLPTLPSGASAGSAWAMIVAWQNSTTILGSVWVNDQGLVRIRNGSSEKWRSTHAFAAGDEFLVTVEATIGSATGHRLRLHETDGTLIEDSGGLDATNTGGFTTVDRFTLQEPATTTTPSMDIRVGRIRGDSATVSGMVPDAPPPTSSPIAALSEDFDAATSGDITTSNSIFDSVPASERAQFTSDSFVGAGAMLLATATAQRETRANFTAAALLEEGFFMKVNSAPDYVSGVEQWAPILYWYSGTTLAGAMQLGSSGAIRLRDSTTTVWTSATLGIGKWHRVMPHLAPGNDGTTDGMRFLIYSGSGIQSTLPAQDSGLLRFNRAAVSTLDSVRFIRPTTAGVSVVIDYHRADALVPPDMSGAGSGPLTVTLTPNVSTVEAWQIVTMSADPTGASGTPTYTFSQLSGTTVTLSGSGASRSFTAPAVRDQEDLSFRVSAVDSGHTATDDVAVTVLPHNEWIYGADGVTLSPVRVTYRRPDGTWWVPSGFAAL